MTAREELVRKFHAMNVDAVEKLHGDEDIMPTLVYGTKDALNLIAIVSDDPDGGAVIMRAIKAAHTQLGPARCVLVTTAAWMVRQETGSDDYVQPSQHPDRVEIVNYSCVDQEGLAFATATITRKDNNVELGELDYHDQTEAGLGGRIADAMYAAVR